MTLSDQRYVSFTTFRRDGTPVASPVWIVDLGDGTFGFATSSTSGKVKRLRNNDKVILQPSNARGKVSDGTAPVEATAEIVEGDRYGAITAKVADKYGYQVGLTKFAGKVRGWVTRKPEPYGDLGVVVTPTAADDLPAV